VKAICWLIFRERIAWAKNKFLIAAPLENVFAKPSGLKEVLSVLTYTQEQLV
jgi:hypothetical protein